MLGSGVPFAGQSAENNGTVEDAFKTYVQAWKEKNIATLQRVIADDYMAVNSEGKVSNKENELITAKNDAIWKTMSVDEIHTHIVDNAAVASGFISAEGQSPDGHPFNAKVRFLAVLVKHGAQWQLLATESAQARTHS